MHRETVARPAQRRFACEKIMFGRFNKLHFVGIGGAGMSGIAEILHNLGYYVQALLWVAHVYFSAEHSFCSHKESFFRLVEVPHGIICVDEGYVNWKSV